MKGQNLIIVMIKPFQFMAMLWLCWNDEWLSELCVRQLASPPQSSPPELSTDQRVEHERRPWEPAGPRKTAGIAGSSETARVE